MKRTCIILPLPAVWHCGRDFAIPYTDFGARMYDPTIAQWMSADPLAESLYPFSSYSFCYDNPLIELLN